MLGASLTLMFALAASESLGVEGPPPRFQKAAVIEVQRPCCGSGVIAFFATIRLSTREDGELSAYVIYMGPQQALPAPGDICDVWVRTPSFGGLTPGTDSLRPPLVNIERMQCGGASYG